MLDGAVASASQRTGRFVSRHPRSLTAAVVIALGGFGATAFGLAPLEADDAPIAQRVVTEIVAPAGLQAQVEALAEQELELYRTDLTRPSDTAESLLRRLNVNDPGAAAFLRSDAVARQLLDGRGGKMVQVRTNASGELDELVARFAAPMPELVSTRFTRLKVTRFGGGFKATRELAPLSAEVRMGSGVVRTTLFAATDAADIPDAVATQLAEAFATDVDMHRELRKGATFSVVYEALTADGEPITWNAGVGRLLAAEFVNDGQTHSAVWFKEGDSKGGYYDLNGQSKLRTFLSSPLEFSRVTSGFSMRMHPVLNTWRAHKGVDYAAPTGTPVRAMGNGVVEFAGWQNGYGNVVHIRHANDRETVYAHLSQIAVAPGQRIEQGALIGAVGATGWATGPHLHFEVKIGGVQQDPLAVAQGSQAVAVSPAARARFAQLAQAVRTQLQVAQSLSSTTYGE
ncbi:M23 family metallopeptidase [Schlegelella sp. ID0723]|uniref:M23 family metallopeptidase n=1 Tax=Piscinibacter koreensis TaxID=2742824 RepID=A0A7Y6NM17_9BURK|nr:M23 family metallopeptidase [Schlegelella koreensis]